jgi:hypothetical protein
VGLFPSLRPAKPQDVTSGPEVRGGRPRFGDRFCVKGPRGQRPATQSQRWWPTFPCWRQHLSGQPTHAHGRNPRKLAMEPMPERPENFWWSTPEAQRVACGFEVARTPEGQQQEQEKADGVRSTAGRASGRPIHSGCELARRQSAALNRTRGETTVTVQEYPLRNFGRTPFPRHSCKTRT